MFACLHPAEGELFASHLSSLLLPTVHLPEQWILIIIEDTKELWVVCGIT